MKTDEIPISIENPLPKFAPLEATIPKLCNPNV
jgi:hypothetical protein